MNRPLAWGLAALLSCAPVVAGAECVPGGKTVFACATDRGKLIEVCDAGRTIDYVFGRPRTRPEIVVRAPRAEASTSQWRGVGRYMSYTVEVPNGDTVYSVFWSVDRLSGRQAVDAGVNVWVKGERVATVHCAAGGKIVQRLEGIDLRPAD